MAGKALAFLACLVMPLNLWYYHSHDLITIDGHLWIAALVLMRGRQTSRREWPWALPIAFALCAN